PLVWCGRTPRVLLPWPLWRELDDLGRRAVVLHELAHLRRRDHWVCWAELAVSVVYWWHPVVWWIRRRLREEADLSCDAWVTALLPAGRRAYAQALLETRKYLSAEVAVTPAIGLGAGTIRAKRFARRLTMVMTEQSAPRVSVRGAILSGTLAVAACLAVPVLACPPDEAAPEPSRAVNLRLSATTAPDPVAAPEPLAGETTFEQFMRTRGQDARHGDADELERRMRELERMLEQMQRRLERYLEAGEAPAGVMRPRRPAVPGPRAGATAPRAPRASVPDAAPAPPARPAPPVPGATAAVPPPGVVGRISGLGGGGVVAFSGEPDCAKVVARTYAIEGGKLADLVELMIREDVPMLVRPLEDGIEVHGNQAQHMIFEAFVKMIDGEAQREQYTLSEGKLEALQKLMARADVPIIVDLQSDSIGVRGTDLEQAVFKAFVKLIDPGKQVETRPIAGASASEYDRQATEAYESARSGGGVMRYRERGRSDATREAGFEAQLVDLETMYAEIEMQIEALEDQIEAIEDEAEAIADRAEEAEEEAEELEEEAEELEEEAEEAEGERRIALLAEARAMREQARAMHQQARAMGRQAVQVERHTVQLERQIERLVQQAERIESRADKIRDRQDEAEDEAENRADSKRGR
ncbi:MAG: M56 family metallopeptidase, partial [Planctomycetota bacterium]